MTTTSLKTTTNSVKTSLATLRAVGALASLAALAACNSDKLVLSNPNAPTVEAAAADPQALQLQANGLLRQLRNGRGAFITSTGRFGREAYIYTPQEGRNTSAYLIGISGQNKLDPAGFAVENWGTQYGNLRDIFNFKNSATNSTLLTAEQKSAALGFARTLEGLELLYVISTRDTLGLVVEIKQNASDLAAFVSRDSAYKYIINTLDDGAAKLAAGGSAFPFTMHAGFNGFNTPSTFRQFNRAIAARANAYYATSGGGTAAWQAALTALTASFMNTGATTRAALDAGPSHPYSTASGDANNPLNSVTNTDLFAHMSIQTDAQLKADGNPDDRYTAKIGTRATRNAPQGLGIASSLGFNMYPTTSSSLPIIRNEELLLLRAEALLATGDKAGAIAIINQIRQSSGGLPASTLTTASTDAAVLTELLYNKRYSLLLEGHRWIDMRRYGRLNQLPLDIATGTNAHFVARVQPIPQGECLVRAGKTGALAGPGC
ncbi:MAG: RagB/SusD family nutrient uptake outer membrane protein [Gemmatimonadaceae bacterium]|nr:RagB/SusD family nutrient uptake outer membrane protein [Gemmatimonadaceae bacterium]